jgi:Uncharacterized protein conserved in bacteria (DUF2252)
MIAASATTAYEKWLGRFVALHRADIEYKHERMSDSSDPFPYFRGTYYRWAQLWKVACPDEADAPRVLTAGDLHIENFGTWIDANGRLCWGVNDFDEADQLPYTNDLVRLAASAYVAGTAQHLDVKLGWVCRAILTGYCETLASGGQPFVLEERHPELRELAAMAERDSAKFWRKLTALLEDRPVRAPKSARQLLEQTLPAPKPSMQVRFRPQTGMGSLGRPRYVVLAEWAGGWIAREAKAMAPPATAWVAKRSASSGMATLVARAIRSPDPFYRPGNKWIVRRLAPQCARIELDRLGSVDDLLRVFWAMGCETANLHAGTPGASERILRDLSHRPQKWLRNASRSAAEALLDDWRDWRREFSNKW